MHFRHVVFRSHALTAAVVVASLASGVGCGATSPENPVVVSAISTPVTAVVGGASTTGTVTISAAAPAGGVAVSLASSVAAATVPASVTVPDGATTAPFSISTTAVASDARATLTATLNGTSRTVDLTVTAPVLASLSLGPSSVRGGASSTGTVAISSAAPAGGLVVALSSSSPSATVPLAVTIASGATSVEFPIATTAVASDVAATITALAGGVTRTATLAITVIPAPPALLSLDLSPAQVVGGDASTGTVTLTSRALPGGAVVVLSSSDSVVSVPASVTVPEGSFTATFPVATTVVLAAESATVSASLGAAVRDAVLALRPDPCAFVTDGAQWLGFSSNRNGSYDLFAIREDGTCLRPLTEGAGDDLFVTWSRVGVFAFMSARSGKMQVWVQGMGGGAASILPTGDLAATSPAFSPDGALVAFEGYAPGVSGSSDIYVVARAGGTPVKLTDGAGYNAGPAWSPDGATIFFVSNRSGRYDVWKVPAAGGAITSVTTSSGILGRPAVTPDGRSLGYCRAAAGEAFSEVVLRDLGTGTIRVVSSQKDCEPAFDRTGQHVAVTSQRSGNPEVLLLDVATGAVVRALTSGTGIDGLAAFAPFP